MYIRPICRRRATAFDQIFTIEGNTFKVRPVDDSADAYELHYYRKIPTLVGG